MWFQLFFKGSEFLRSEVSRFEVCGLKFGGLSFRDTPGCGQCFGGVILCCQGDSSHYAMFQHVKLKAETQSFRILSATNY